MKPWQPTIRKGANSCKRSVLLRDKRGNLFQPLLFQNEGVFLRLKEPVHHRRELLLFPTPAN